jgi:hypothetical protein
MHDCDSCTMLALLSDIARNTRRISEQLEPDFSNEARSVISMTRKVREAIQRIPNPTPKP